MTKVFPSYMTPFITYLFTPDSLTILLISVLVIAFLFILLSVFLYFFRLQKTLKETYVYLEVKPTDKTLKSPLSTNQLFVLLHSLGKQNSAFERLINLKRNISLELVSTKEEGIRYILRVLVKDVSMVKKTLLAYLPGIEIDEVTDYLSSQLGSSNKNYLGVKGLKLAKPYVYPLQDQSTLNQYDPIAYITAHMTKLNENELVSLQFICTPVREQTHGNIISHNRELNKLLLNNADIGSEIQKGTSLSVIEYLDQLIEFVFKLIFVIVLSPFTIIGWLMDKKDTTPILAWWIFEEKQGKRLNELGLPKQQLYQTIQNKINQPLFEVTIRFISINKDKEGSDRRLNSIISSFGTFSTANQSLKAKEPLTLKSKYFQKLLNLQLEKRLSVLSTSSILSVSELSSLYHFPYTATTQTEDLQKIKSPELPPPLSLKKTDINFDIMFAKNSFGETTVPIGQTLEERRRHTYLIGATGTGKTTLLLQMIYQDLINGKGIAIIDPHGDLSKRILEIVPKDRLKDVIYFNPYDIEYPIGLNFLELPKGLSTVEKEREKDFITSSLVSIFHKLYDARYSGPRMEHILRNVTLTALELENPTLFTIYELLTNRKYRKQIVDVLNNQVLKAFWKNEFNAQGSFQRAEQISPITNKLGRFLTTTMTRNILNQTKSKLDFNEIMDNKKILLCDLSKGKIGEDNSFFLGSLIIAKLELAAFRRINFSQDKRIDFFLYVDEFQNFATTTFAQVLSEARKYRLNAILVHQNTVQLENDLLDTIIGNSGTIISFRTSSPKDEDKLLPIFSPQVEEGQIANLPSYHFYVKINALQPQDAFTGEIDDFTVRGSREIKEKVIAYSRKNYGMKIAIIEQPSIREMFNSKKKPSKNVNKFEMTK